MGSKAGHGFSKYNILLCLTLILAGIVSVFGQEIKVIRAQETAAVINAGSNLGFRVGGQVRVMRMRNGMWREISRGIITKVTPDMARIDVVRGAPRVNFKTGDIIVKISINPNSRITIPATSSNSQRAGGKNQNRMLLQPRGVYVGPTMDILLPLENMKTIFDDQIGYGALVGFRFENNFDVSIRFSFTSKSNEWSFWDLQLLGRVYDASNLFADFGYSICYPGITKTMNESFSAAQVIRMGFVLGAGYPIPLSTNKQFEIGFLYHYYPNFGKDAGQFLSIHGRLILKSSF